MPGVISKPLTFTQNMEMGSGFRGIPPEYSSKSHKKTGAQSSTAAEFPLIGFSGAAGAAEFLI